MIVDDLIINQHLKSGFSKTNLAAKYNITVLDDSKAYIDDLIKKQI